MTDLNNPHSSIAWRWTLAGLLIGILIGAGATAFSIQARGQVLAQRQLANAVAAAVQTKVSLASPTAVSSATAIRQTVTTLTPQPSLSPTPVPIDPAILDLEAQLANDPKADVRSQLQALLGKESDPQNLARAFTDMGQLETGLGNVHLAYGYYEQAYATFKTPENLLKLAQADVAAVELTEARVHFTELINWPGAEADPYREAAKSGLEAASQIQGELSIN